MILPTPLFTPDAEGRIRFWNGASERIFGYSATEAWGRE
jgi:PAS domain S-box-containing protein